MKWLRVPESLEKRQYRGIRMVNHIDEKVESAALMEYSQCHSHRCTKEKEYGKLDSFLIV